MHAYDVLPPLATSSVGNGSGLGLNPNGGARRADEAVVGSAAVTLLEQFFERFNQIRQVCRVHEVVKRRAHQCFRFQLQIIVYAEI